MRTMDPAAERPVTIGARASEQVSAAAHVFNRLGRLLTRLSHEHDLEIESIIAVWLAQSGGRIFVPRRAYLHFEVQKFYEGWGHLNRQDFDTHFRFGGHNMQAGQWWENQDYREDVGGIYHAVHHNQNSEYAALTMARTLAGDARALSSACVGGCLLSVAEFRWVGYQKPDEMFDAFEDSERAQVLGFFDYCCAKPSPKTNDLLRYLKLHDWVMFARHFPSTDQTPLDVERLRAAYSSAALMMRSPS